MKKKGIITWIRKKKVRYAAAGTLCLAAAIGILVLGLGLIMPSEYAVIISIISRLWMTVSELALIGIAFVVNQVMERCKKR